MNTKQILAQLSEWAGGEFIQKEEWELLDGDRLTYCLNPAGEIVSLQVTRVNVEDLSPLSQLTALQQLDCRFTKISDLSPLSELTALQHLDCGDTKISDLSPLSQLKELEVLEFIGTLVSDLSPLSQLKELEVLDFRGTLVSNLSPLSELTALQNLDCRYTKVSDLSPLLKLKHLQQVNAYDCQIVNLPREITRLGLTLYLDFTKEGIILENNPLENPPIEVIARGNEAVESYFDSLKGELTPLNEIKVILVGEGAAGKTSVVNRLIYNTFDKKEAMTDGIKITPWQIKTGIETIKANVWDFGGQEIMRATHQLFLSKRCVYLLVLDGRKDERPEHWLKQILSVTSEANILVVCNKIDENPDNNLQRQHLKEKYPQIVGFFPLSCLSTDGIEPLKTRLTNLIIDLPMRRIELAANWVVVKQQLETWSGAKDFISHDSFVELCMEQGVETELAQEVLLDLLHDLGLVIHFKQLKHLQTQVLNPRWITEGIYALITSKELTQQGGLLAESEAQYILTAKVKHYRYDNKVHFLMRVMEQFELCYSLSEGKVGGGQNQYLVPSLLPVELDKPAKSLTGRGINFVFKYEGFMPAQVMPRFIVKSHNDIANGQSWRSGVILENQTLASTAKVVADGEEGEISIAVVGEQRRDFFAVIRDYFDKIHQSYDQDNLGLKSLVVLKHGRKTSRVDYQRLIKLEQRYLAGKHNGQDYDQVLNIDFSVVDVLNGLGSSETRQKDREKMGMNRNDKYDNTPNIRIEVNPTMNQNQSSQQQTDVSQQVSISIEIKSLAGKLENWTEDLIDELSIGQGASGQERVSQDNHQIEKEVNKVQQAMQEIKSVEQQEQAEDKIGKFERVCGFIADALNGDNKTGEFLQTAGQGVKKLQDIGKQYNKIAANFGFPVVPEVLL